MNFSIKRILFSIYILIGGFIISVLGHESALSAIFSYLYIPIFIVAYTIISVITVPLFISFLIELYYEYRNYEVTERSFEDINKENNKIYRFIQNHKSKLSILICIIFLSSTFLRCKEVILDYVGDNLVDITAHRGSSKAPENSISSIEFAINEEANYCEIDVMTSKDNNVVLFHDSTLKRIDKTNRRIKDMTLDEIKEVDNGSYFDISYKAEPIPTLEEVLILSKGKMKLNIELKPVGKDDTLAYEVARLIKKYDMEDEVVVSSINYNSIQEFRCYLKN